MKVNEYKIVKVLDTIVREPNELEETIKMLQDALTQVPEEHRSTIDMCLHVDYDGEWDIRISYEQPLTGDEKAAAMELNRVRKEASVRDSYAYSLKTIRNLTDKHPELVAKILSEQEDS